MDEFDNLDNYNGEPVHDMEVDDDHHISPWELPTIVIAILTTILFLCKH